MFKLIELDDFEATLLQLDNDKFVDNKSETKVVDAEITLYAFGQSLTWYYENSRKN